MPDFTMCRGHETLKTLKGGGHTYLLHAQCKTCVRQTARPKSGGQSYFTEAPMVENVCVEYLPPEMPREQMAEDAHNG